MSDIKAGDLVMVVKPTLCCGRADSVGKIFTAQTVAIGILRCIYCNERYSAVCVDIQDKISINRSRLIKIDPPALADDTTTDEQIDTREHA